MGIYDEIENIKRNSENSKNQEVAKLRKEKQKARLAEEERQKALQLAKQNEEEEKAKKEREEARLKEEALKQKAIELIRDIITSTDENLDETAWIETYCDDEKIFSDKQVVNKPISVREAMLSILLDKPYTMYASRGISRDIYRNTITLHPELSEEQEILAKHDRAERKAITEATKKSNDPTLDAPGLIKASYVSLKESYTTKNVDSWIKIPTIGDNLPHVDYLEVPVTQRELLTAGLDPRELGWESLERDKKQKPTLLRKIANRLVNKSK